MQDLMNWNYEDDELPSKTPNQPTSSPFPALIYAPTQVQTKVVGLIVWFTDLWDHQLVRKGTVVRTMTVLDKFPKPRTQPTDIVLELVAYTDEDGKEIYDVIWPERHAHPKAPTK